MADPKRILRKQAPQLSLRERLGALRYIGRLFREVWKTSPLLACAALGLRLIVAFQPILTFYVGKLIVDEIVSLSHLAITGQSFSEWLFSGKLTKLSEYVGLELILTIGFDVVSRAISLSDGLLSEKHSNRLSMALMVHAASLDLAHFENSTHQDELERARGQAVWSSNFLSQVFGQCESLMSLVTLVAGLLAYALLLIFALIPAVWNEAHFNALAYKVNFNRTEERRKLDYLCNTGINAETAKEIKLFGLSVFLMEQFYRLSSAFYVVNKRLAIQRHLWTWLFYGLSTTAYYSAYAVIIWRTVSSVFSIGDLTFLTGSFLRLRGLIQSLLFNAAWMSARALDLRDLFSFFDIEPKIVSPKTPVPFPKLVHRGIEFQDVGFKYPDSGQWALRHLSFTLHRRNTRLMAS